MMEWRLPTTPMLAKQLPVSRGTLLAVQLGFSAGLMLRNLFLVSVCVCVCVTKFLQPCFAYVGTSTSVHLLILTRWVLMLHTHSNWSGSNSSTCAHVLLLLPLQFEWVWSINTQRVSISKCTLVLVPTYAKQGCKNLVTHTHTHTLTRNKFLSINPALKPSWTASSVPRETGSCFASIGVVGKRHSIINEIWAAVFRCSWSREWPCYRALNTS